MSEKDFLNCLAILEAIEKIERYTQPHHSAEQWIEDQISYDASLMNFVVIGEMTAKMSDAFLGEHKNIEWNKIKAFRNIIAHDYLGIDFKEVWQITQNKLPELKIQLKQITGK